MDFQIDADDIDEEVVRLMILHICEAMMKADHIDPTVEESVVAFVRLIEMVTTDNELTLH